MDNNAKTKMIVAVIVSLIVIIGLSIALVVIGTRKMTSYSSSSTPCPIITNTPKNFELDIPTVSMWTHKSSVKGEGLPKIELNIQCPSITTDYEIFVDGALAAKTETDYWSSSNRFTIKDCHGNSLFIAKTDGWLDSLKNSFKFKSSYMIFDGKNENNLVAFVEETNFFGKEIIVKDTSNGEILRMNRGIFAFDWKVAVNNTLHPVANPIFANVIAHKKAQYTSRNKKKKRSDTCNGLFFGGIVFLICLVTFSFCVCGSYVVNEIRKRKAEGNTTHQRFAEERLPEE
jgi:hypothetical protein